MCGYCEVGEVDRSPPGLLLTLLTFFFALLIGLRFKSIQVVGNYGEISNCEAKGPDDFGRVRKFDFDMHIYTVSHVLSRQFASGDLGLRVRCLLDMGGGSVKVVVCFQN